MPSKRSAWLVIALSAVLLIVSLFLPAIQFQLNPTQIRGGGEIPGPFVAHTGFQMLLSSIFGPISGNFAILANPLLLLGWIFLALHKFGKAAFTLCLSTVFALETFQLYFSKFYEDEGGVNYGIMLYPKIGWFLWLAAILVPLFAAILWRQPAPRSAIPPTV